MNFYTKRTPDQQALRLPHELREAYKNSQLDRITIFDGTQELEITGYAEYSYLDEKSYKTQPVRTQDGTIQDIEEYATFLIPRVIIKYNMMGIEDYRSLMKMFKKRNGYIVKCYDVVEDKIVKNEMYVATPSMPKIYQQYLIAMGIQEYNIELIGTGAPIVVDVEAGENAEANGTQLITVLIDDTEYEANFGMSWGEWVQFVPTFHEDGRGGIYRKVGTSVHYVKKPNGDTVRSTDYIYIDQTYYTM